MAGETLEHLLCALPFAQPLGILDQLKQKHPKLKITWRDVGGVPLSTIDSVPTG